MCTDRWLDQRGFSVYYTGDEPGSALSNFQDLMVAYRNDIHGLQCLSLAFFHLYSNSSKFVFDPTEFSIVFSRVYLTILLKCLLGIIDIKIYCSKSIAGCIFFSKPLEARCHRWVEKKRDVFEIMP